MSGIPDQARGWGLVPFVALMAACGSGPTTTVNTSRPHIAPSAFFAGELPDYAKDLDGTSRSRLLMLRAIRKVDPCALAPNGALEKAQPPLMGAVGGDSLDSCRLSFADDGPGERFDVSIVPVADRSPGEEYFQVDGHDVYQGRSTDSATCSFFFDSGLAKYPGAPRDVPDAKIQVRAYRHDKPCALANSVATAIAQAKPAELPSRNGAEKLLGADPCASVADGNKALVDFADTDAYRCGLVIGSDEHSLSVEFHRLPESEVGKFQAGKQDSVSVWTDPAAGPLAALLTGPAPSPSKGASPTRPPVKTSSSAAKNPPGQRCAAYVKADGDDAAPEATPAAKPMAQNTTLRTYVIVSGQIDCAEAKRLAVAAQKQATR